MSLSRHDGPDKQTGGKKIESPRDQRYIAKTTFRNGDNDPNKCGETRSFVIETKHIHFIFGFPRAFQSYDVRGTTDQNCPLRPGTTGTICTSWIMTGGPGKEHGTNGPPPTRSKHQSTCPTNLPESFSLEPSWLSNACMTRKDPESE